MSDLNISEMWDSIKTKLSDTYTHLTESDLNLVKGKEQEMVSNLQEKLGKTKDEVVEMFNNIKSKL